jgi:hypothetical protein
MVKIDALRENVTMQELKLEEASYIIMFVSILACMLTV